MGGFQGGLHKLWEKRGGSTTIKTSNDMISDNIFVCSMSIYMLSRTFDQTLCALLNTTFKIKTKVKKNSC